MESKTLKSKFGIVSRTNVGMVRSNNEDFHGYSTNIFEKDWHFYEESVVPVNEKPILLVVADGMGGLEMGEEASRIAVETTKKYFFDNAEEIVKNITVLNQKMNLLFTEINNEILDFAKQSNNEGQTGTTLIISLIIKKKAYIFWIGDSRAYLFRNGSLKPLTKDHSYVQELVDKGKLTYEQSFFHPDSNIITKYMGDPKNTPKPSYVEIDLEKGDVLMLCTDGLNGMLQDKDIESVFYESDDLKQICEKLIDNANEVGGNDNNTIILTAFDDFAKYIPEKMATGNETIQSLQPNKKVGKLKIIIAVLAGLLLGLTIMYFAKDYVFNDKESESDNTEEEFVKDNTEIEELSEITADTTKRQDYESIEESHTEIRIANEPIVKIELSDSVKTVLLGLIQRLQSAGDATDIDKTIIQKASIILQNEKAEIRFYKQKLNELAIELDKKDDRYYTRIRNEILKLIENL